MDLKLLFLSLLSLFSTAICESSLQIIKKVDKSFIPLSSTDSRFCLVEEQVGAHFSLLCELVFSRNETGYDDHISWIKKSNRFNASVDFDKLSPKNLEDFYDSLASSELNKAEKKFEPLRTSDNGSYICFTVKYKKYINVDILVRSDERITIERPMVFREPMFCTDKMFRCMSNGVCIIAHYVCDGRPDCKDGSDESFETCQGDPCKDKLKCDDGRCIPTSWCCDINTDANCTVTNRPKCCQVSETYGELEYGLPNLTAIQQNNAGAKYLFISICILSILFSMVLVLLILSKVMMYAKKTSPQQRHGSPDVAYYHQGSARTGRDQSIAMCHIPYNLYSLRDNNRDESGDLELDESDCGNPLLNLPGRHMADLPPSYGEVVRSRRHSDPPPPYSSREMLNEDGDMSLEIAD